MAWDGGAAYVAVLASGGLVLWCVVIISNGTTKKKSLTSVK